MASRSLPLFLALTAVFLLTLGIVGCKEPLHSSKSTVLKPDRTKIGLFGLPRTLSAAQVASIPNPLIVMVSSDPWLMVSGSDSPAFALYSDGTVIFATKAGYKSAKLDGNHLKETVHAFKDPELPRLSGRYVATGYTDQPENRLLIYANKIPFYVSVYGSLENASVRSKLPPRILSSFDRLRSFSASAAQPWLPSFVEVMIWPYEYAPDRSIVWPKRWPDLNAPTSRKRGDSYSIFLPSSELPALKAFLASRKEKGAIDIDGKKWAASFRLPFPYENLWMAQATR